MNQIMRALIVDDEDELRNTVSAILKDCFQNILIRIDEANNGLSALDLIHENNYDLVLMDVRMPKMDGIQALAEIKKHDPRTFVVIMTAHANLQDAIEAIKVGAYDYIEKPVQPEKLKTLIKSAMDAQEMVLSLALSKPIFDDDIESELVGSSNKMRQIFDLTHRLQQLDTTVLIRGENGTGKELVARAIHFNSPHKQGPFVAINCGAIPEYLMESELFGHEKGAFAGANERKIGKFQLANRGTLFLDEIGELQPNMQFKLLKVIQEKKFTPVGGTREIKTTARFIAATNRNLEKMIEEGIFREDLFYRLNVLPLFLPPLRERIDDLEELAGHFIQRFNRLLNRQINDIEPEALHALKSYRWPGNIRELENVIERAFILESGSRITLESLTDPIRQSLQRAAGIYLDMPNYYSGPMDYDRFKEQSEKEFITAALTANQGKINKTVAHANIPKNTLLRKIKKYGINVKELGRD